MELTLNRTMLAPATVMSAGCVGVPAGSLELDYVVWGYVGQGQTGAASGTTASLVDASRRTARSETTDWAGKYTFVEVFSALASGIATPLMLCWIGLVLEPGRDR